MFLTIFRQKLPQNVIFHVFSCQIRYFTSFLSIIALKTPIKKIENFFKK